MIERINYSISLFHTCSLLIVVGVLGQHLVYVAAAVFAWLDSCCLCTYEGEVVLMWKQVFPCFLEVNLAAIIEHITFKTWTDTVVDGVDVVFGPSCEYSLAAVARQIKFYNVSEIYISLC